MLEKALKEDSTDEIAKNSSAPENKRKWKSRIYLIFGFWGASWVAKSHEI